MPTAAPDCIRGKVLVLGLGALGGGEGRGNKVCILGVGRCGAKLGCMFGCVFHALSE